MRYTVEVYPQNDPYARYVTIEADGKVVANVTRYYPDRFEVDASQYVKVSISAIKEYPWRVVIRDEKGNVVASSDNVYRDNPLIYRIPMTTTATTTTTTTTTTATTPSTPKYVEKAFEYPLSAQTGAGWLPFVFEKELTVDLSAFASSDFEIVDAVLYLRVDTTCWGADGISVEVNGKSVYDGSDRTFQGSIKNAITAGVNRVRVVLKPNPVAGMVTWLSLYCADGASLSGKLTVTVRKYLETGETTQDAESRLREVFKVSAVSTAQLQGYTVASVKDTPQGLQLNVVDLAGAVKPLNFNIGGIGMGIAVLFFVLFLILLIVLVLRR